MTISERSVARLDEVDSAIVRTLRRDGRASNRQLAAAAGVAESTAHARLRSLESRRIIVGYEAILSREALGQDVQALIGVSLRAGARQAHIVRFTEHVRSLPQVLQYFFVGGNDDFAIHVAVASTGELRQFIVSQISGHSSVASTRSSIIFEYGREASAL